MWVLFSLSVMVLGDLKGNLYSAIAYRESGIYLCHRGNQTYEVVGYIKGRSQVVRPAPPRAAQAFAERGQEACF